MTASSISCSPTPGAPPPGQAQAVAQGCAAGVLILTGRGHIPMERVRPGDLVLTHRNRWRPVHQVVDLGFQPTVRVRGSGHAHGLRITPGTRLYLRGDRPRGGLSQPRWRPVRDVTPRRDRDDRWAAPTTIPPLPLPDVARPYPCGRQNHLDPAHLSSEDSWFLVGLFTSEGSTGSSYGAGGARNRCVWSLNVAVEAKATAALDHLGLNWNRWQPASGAKVAHIVVASATLTAFMLDVCGHRAAGKRLHPAVLGLPATLRAATLDGLLTGDGHQRGRSFTYSTVSRRLAFDARQLAMTLGTQASVEYRPTPSTRVIQGRTVCSRDLYRVQGCPHPTNSRFRWDPDTAMAWGRVLDIHAHPEAPCWDLDVADDRSYVAEGVVVHGR